MNIYEISELKLFNDFDPFKDQVPETIFWDVGHIVQRATQILKERTIDQLQNALILLRQWRIFAVAHSLPELQKLYGDQDSISSTGIHAMYLTMGRFDLATGNPYKFNAAELFATLALGKVGALVTCEPMNHSEPGYRTTLTEAEEAMGFSETVSINIMRGKRQSANKKKGIATKYDSVRREVIIQYRTMEKGISNRKAGIIIAERLRDLLERTLRTDDPPKSIETWIGKYKKGNLDGVEDLPPYDA